MQKFINKIICGDCIELLNGLKEPFADLIFADPPFNIGYKYDKYEDKVKREKYIAWTMDWMSTCFNVLKPDGSFYIAIGDDYAADVKKISEDLDLVMRNWIIWHYTFGQQTKNKFARSKINVQIQKANCRMTSGKSFREFAELLKKEPGGIRARCRKAS